MMCDFNACSSCLGDDACAWVAVDEKDEGKCVLGENLEGKFYFWLNGGEGAADLCPVVPVKDVKPADHVDSAFDVLINATAPDYWTFLLLYSALVIIAIATCTLVISVVFKYCKRTYQGYRNGNNARARQQQWRATFGEDDDEEPIQMEDFVRQEEARASTSSQNHSEPNDLMRFSVIEENFNFVSVL